MLTGTADPEALAIALGAPRIPAFGGQGASKDGVVLEDVVEICLVAELRRAGREALLPPALHPTDPPSLSIVARRVGDSPWGSFSACWTRVSCRSGARARALTTAMVVDGAPAATGLAETFGFPARPGTVQVDQFYDRSDVVVAVDGRTILALAGLDPRPLAHDDLQHASTLNLARTPRGLRLVQVEARHESARTERLHGRLRTFDPTAWGPHELDPYDVVATVVTTNTTVTLPQVRFVCRPDVNAFEGTEAV